MKQYSKLCRLVLIGLVIAAFAGCGGGGGSNPQPTPTPGPFTRPIDFTDDFSDASSGWAKGVYVGYSGGEYFLLSTGAPEEFVWSTFPRWLVNYRAGVDVRNIYDKHAIGGLVFNYSFTGQLQNYGYYVFTIAPKHQYFTVARYYDFDHWSYLTKLEEKESDSIIPTTGATNRLEVDVKDNGEAKFYINGTEVWSTIVIMHAAGERVGFCMSNYREDDIQMNFDNFHVVGTELVK